MRKIFESITFAYQSIKGDKFRAFLSLLGVTIGIFAIVAVFTAIEALETNVRDVFDVMGSDVIYVDKTAWTTEGIDWWEYRQRPSIKYEEFLYLQEHCTLADKVAFSAMVRKSVKSGRNSVSGVGVRGISYYWNQLSPFEIDKGRYFTMAESLSSVPIAVIGQNVANELFPNQDPIDKTIKIGGHTARVVGVIKKQGNSLFDISAYDISVIVPLPFIRNMIDLRRTSPSLVVHKAPQADQEEFMAQLRSVMRNVRRLRPIQNDNFALNQVSFLDDMLNQIFSVISTAGWIIGGFSILIGAFGIANIMFVSVKERTNIIGIEKALGAKSYFILIQFLFEAAVLALIGGIIGILVVWGVAEFVTIKYDFVMTLSLRNVLRGLLVSGGVGLVAGLVPSYQAAHMNPVEAINQH